VERRDGQSNDVDNANGGAYLPRKRNAIFSDEAIYAGLVAAIFSLHDSVHTL
jgi:hypothetical protein